MNNLFKFKDLYKKNFIYNIFLKKNLLSNKFNFNNFI